MTDEANQADDEDDDRFAGSSLLHTPHHNQFTQPKVLLYRERDTQTKQKDSFTQNK